MTPKVAKTKKKQKLVQATITSLQETAETIKMDALQFAQTISRQPERATGLEERLQRHDFCNTFKLGLAERLANTLAAYDEHVLAVYYFDPNLNPDAETEAYAPPDGTINLLVLVESHSAALDSFIAALDGALTRELVALPGPLFASQTSIINAILITQEDVRQKRGYAALLSSHFYKPRQLV